MDAWTRILKGTALAPAVVVSTVLWLMLAALMPAGLGSLLLLGVCFVTVLLGSGRMAEPASRVLAGARAPTEGEQFVLAPVASRIAVLEVDPVRLRVSRSMSPHPAIRPAGRDVVVVSPALVEAIFHQLLDVEEAAALVAHGAGRLYTQRTSTAYAIAAWTLPWRPVAGFARRVGAGARWLPLVGLAWHLRAAVGAVAVVQSIAEGRTISAVVVASFLTASYLTPVAQRTWATRVQRAADQFVAAHGLGAALLDALRRIGAPAPDTDRIARLRHQPKPPSSQSALRLVPPEAARRTGATTTSPRRGS